MWVARNPDNKLQVFKIKPVRHTLEVTNKTKGSKRYDKTTVTEFWDEEQVFDGYDKHYYPGDYFDVDESLFPDLKWEDEPIEVDIMPSDFCKKLLIDIKSNIRSGKYDGDLWNLFVDLVKYVDSKK